jgi:environmental stress-induced protein Ves
VNDIIRAGDLAESPWVNGAGRKADIASGDGWLLGFAWLDRDAPFSDYAGHDRTIMLLEGPGFALDLPAGSTLTVTRAFDPAAFDGAGPMACHVSGPCRVLNAISAYPGFSHTMQVMTGADVATVTPGDTPEVAVFAVVLRGSAGAAGPLDTIRLAEPMAAPNDTLLAVIRFRRDSA